MARIVKNRCGFSLIELLVVLSVIAVLSAIATPTFLGTREKSRQKAVVASARVSVSEMRGMADSFGSGEPFIVFESPTDMKCLEHENAASNKRCSRVFPEVSSVGTYSNDDVGELVSIAIDSYQGRGLPSPYGISPTMFVGLHGTVGTVVISPAGSRSVNICAYGLDVATPIFNATIKVL